MEGKPSEIKPAGSLPEPPEEIRLARIKEAIDWKRVFFILLGLGLFFLCITLPPGKTLSTRSARHSR